MYFSAASSGTSAKKQKDRISKERKGNKMNYADYFYRFKQKFIDVDVSDIKEHYAFQFNIVDNEAGGSFYIEVKDGNLFIEPYEFHDRDAAFTCTPELLDKIVAKKQDPVTAFLSHKLKVEGDIDKALKFKEFLP